MRQPTPGWALITEGAFMRLPARTQMVMVEDAEARYPALVGPGVGVNAKARWEQIQAAREAFYEPGERAKPAVAPHILTASECNEWLRSLPPVPFYGEPRQTD